VSGEDGGDAQMVGAEREKSTGTDGEETIKGKCWTRLVLRESRYFGATLYGRSLRCNMNMKYEEEQQRMKDNLKEDCFSQLSADKDASAEEQIRILNMTFGDRLRRWEMSAHEVYAKWLEKVRAAGA
jgi:hypothetical protein